jgi:hypothetical protein
VDKVCKEFKDCLEMPSIQAQPVLPDSQDGQDPQAQRVIQAQPDLPVSQDGQVGLETQVHKVFKESKVLPMAPQDLKVLKDLKVFQVHRVFKGFQV